MNRFEIIPRGSPERILSADSDAVVATGWDLIVSESEEPTSLRIHNPKIRRHAEPGRFLGCRTHDNAWKQSRDNP